MKDFISTAIFLLMYFITRNFSIALQALCLCETLFVIKEWVQTKKVSYSSVGKLSILWVSVLLTVIFKNPIYFQYKTTLVYLIFGALSFWAPLSWRDNLYNESLSSMMTKENYYKLCPQIARIFFAGALTNAVGIKYLSLAQWIIFKPFLALGISISMMIAIYKKNLIKVDSK